MTRRESRASSAALCLFLLLALALLFKNADVAASGVRMGLSLCAKTLLPALFPFLVLSELLVSSGVGERLCGAIGAPIRFLTGLSKRGATCFLLGALCGFPVATTAASTYLSRGEISKKEAERVLLFANNPGAGFLVAFVGEGLLGAKQKGFVLLLSTLGAALCFGALLHLFDKRGEQEVIYPTNGMENGLSVSLFTTSVKRALSAALTLAAFVVLFSSITSCLSAALAALGAPLALDVLLHGVLELTSGLVSASALPTKAALPTMAFFCSFSGLSVCFQIHAVADGIDAPIGQYLAAKTAQGALAALFAFLFSLI